MKKGFSEMRCGLIGEHLGHSFSPQIHRELADYSYELFELSPDKVGSFVKNTSLDAFNVTIPYKKTVIPFLDCISPEAEALGAVNTVVRKNGLLCGYNTDYFGFDYMIRCSGISVENKKAIVLGRGGASATVCAVLKDKGVSSLTVIGREDNTPENLKNYSDAQIIVNATPVGMYPKNGVSPLTLDLFPHCLLVLDLIYNPARTQLILDAIERGIVAVNGLPMLVAQAAKAFELFTGETANAECIEKIVSEISKSTRNIIFIGMPGCGKTTVGRLLAKVLGRNFFDADGEFTAMHGITPADAITTLGEDTFRKMEHETLTELCKKSEAVISTGGGAVTRGYNYPLMHQNGTVLFLERELSMLTSKGRPLSQSMPISQLYRQRIDAYNRFADIKLQSTGIPQKTAELAKELLDSHDFSCVFAPLKNKGENQ